MAKRLEQFTNEQIEILLKNPNVADATTNTIKFTPEFKKLALQKTEEGMVKCFFAITLIPFIRKYFN